MPDAIKIQMVLDKVQIFLAKWLDSHLRDLYKVNFWQSAVLNALTPDQRINVEENGAESLDDLDFATLVAVFLGNFKALRKELHLDLELSDMAKHVKKIRNLYAHKDSKAIKNPNPKKVKYHFETLHQFMDGLGAEGNLLREIDELNISSVDSKLRANSALQSTVVASNGVKIRVSSAPATQNLPNVVIEKNDGGCLPVKQTTQITVSSPSQPLKQVLSQKAAGADISSTVAPRSTAMKTITTQEKSNGNPVNCDIAHVYECKNYLDMAREVFPQYFDSSSLIISSADREASPVQGKSAWDYLVLLHCKSDHQEARRLINSFYQCMDTTPYVQDEYIVWQFPRYVEQDLEDYNVADIYPIGVLPSMFDDFISSKEGTSYCPDAKRVEHNDNATEKDALWYLGNYFPRSFAETFCIFDFALPYALEKILGGRDELSICDVGVGSGGATLGLIWALRKYLSGKGIKRIRLYGFDINEHALNLFSGMLPLMKREWPIDFDVTLRKTKFTAVKIIPADVIDRKVDFVITSKCLQEVASRISVSIEQIYNRFIEDARSVVSSKGLMAIMEIARPFRSSSLNKALSGIGPELATLIPNGEGMPIVGEERFELNSSRIGRIVGENLLFSVIGDKSFKEAFPEWVPAPKPILNEQDVDSEREESEIQREG